MMNIIDEGRVRNIINAVRDTIGSAQDKYNDIMNPKPKQTNSNPNKSKQYNFTKTATTPILKKTDFSPYVSKFDYDATYDEDNGLVKVVFSAKAVPSTLATRIRPDHKDDPKSLYKYFDNYDDGEVTLLFPFKDKYKKSEPDNDKSETKGDKPSEESMMTPTSLNYSGKRTLQCNNDGIEILKEDYEEDYYELLQTKTVYDSDGFTTDYTLYKDLTNNTWICIFGDQELYNPTNTSPDMEFDNEEEAEDWFRSYEGLVSDEDEDEEWGL